MSDLYTLSPKRQYDERPVVNTLPPSLFNDMSHLYPPTHSSQNTRTLPSLDSVATRNGNNIKTRVFDSNIIVPHFRVWPTCIVP